MTRMTSVFFQHKNYIFLYNEDKLETHWVGINFYSDFWEENISSLAGDNNVIFHTLFLDMTADWIVKTFDTLPFLAFYVLSANSFMHLHILFLISFVCTDPLYSIVESHAFVNYRDIWGIYYHQRIWCPFYA